MTSGYYLFSCSIVNNTTQSAIAMSAYRSGEKLYSLSDGLTKSYRKREIEPESFILKPDHAPDWTLSRETLWNNVEQFEERDNARIARNVLLGLPNDMTNEQQLELTKEYVQETFVDEGMVADVSIHRDEANNPHAHILLTVREFNENQEFEKRKSKRIPVLDQDGNQVYNDRGWRKTRSVKLNNWDDKKTLVKWRENWAEKLNEKSSKLGLDRQYSDKSYEAQGKLEKPRFRLTRSEYQFEEKVKQQAIDEKKEYKPTTYYAKQNEEIKNYNEKVSQIVHLKDYQADKQYQEHLDQMRKRMHVNASDVEATQLLVQRVKGYVDYDVSKKLFVDFNNERNKWKLKLERSESILQSKTNLYAKLINEHKENPSFVERYGYDSRAFKEEIKHDLLELQKDENKVAEERAKFEELKEATKISLHHQERMVDAEFDSIYKGRNESEFSYEEKNFAMKLLKDHNILLPEDMIKDEHVKQGKDKEHSKLYVPTWKQAKDTMTSIDIYNRTINKLGRSNVDKLNPDELKDTVIKLNTFKDLKSDYEGYLKEISPLIDEEIKSISSHESFVNADMDVKVALLEEYSKLDGQQKKNLDTDQFLQDVKDHYDELSVYAVQQEKESDQDRKQVYKDLSDRASNVTDGLFAILQDLANEKPMGHDKGKRNRTKPYRRKGADGREL